MLVERGCARVVRVDGGCAVEQRGVGGGGMGYEEPRRGDVECDKQMGSKPDSE